MKSIIYIIFLFFILFVGSCKERPGNKMNKDITTEKKTDIGSIQSMNDLYQAMTTVPLPFVFNYDFIMNETNFIRLPENMYSLFYSADSFDLDTRIAKFPEGIPFKPILVYYADDHKEPIMDIYTLSDNMDLIDHIMIYCVEEVDGDNVIIRHTYEITDDFTIQLTKHMNGVLIEQLYYHIDDKGVFTEIRDGKTPTIAYESYDGVTYIVESFVWDYNNRGGLIKKDLKRTFYRINDTFDVIETEQL